MRDAADMRTRREAGESYKQKVPKDGPRVNVLSGPRGALIGTMKTSTATAYQEAQRKLSQQVSDIDGAQAAGADFQR